MRIWGIISSALERDGACVLVSVTQGAGSTPRDAGARMVVRKDGSLAGTIGGGHLEFQAHHLAMNLLATKDDALVPSRTYMTRRFSLGPDLGQCCGGRADLSFEVITRDACDTLSELRRAEEAGGQFVTRMSVLDGVPGSRQIASVGFSDVSGQTGWIEEVFGESRQKLYLFGAGHVGRAVVLSLAALPFDVIWIDSRRESFPTHMPAQVTPILSAEPASELAHAVPGSFVLVMTHNHGLDEEIVAAALARNCFGYVGLIGSQTKRKRFETRLKARGLTPAALEELVCPVGCGRLRSKLPAAIAADIALQLLEKQEMLESRLSSAPYQHQALAKTAISGR
ncbi:xanthine dehydrogenase accessory protein XdhC [Roseibium sp.]|uniref:xanthine dehydrogenase accessory protein XdhC n=1 Tax=Roseibium sp. TaxID=1936156 RepID=UPI003A96B853